MNSNNGNNYYESEHENSSPIQKANIKTQINNNNNNNGKSSSAISSNNGNNSNNGINGNNINKSS